MKQIFGPTLILLIMVVGCVTANDQDISIVGVWEMTEVRIADISEMPPVEITNKKDIYTADGIYHDTAAGSTNMTDVRPRTYTLDDGRVTIFREGGEKSLEAKVRFTSRKVMEMTTPDGTAVIFTRVSDDPEAIPKLRERVIPIRMK